MTQSQNTVWQLNQRAEPHLFLFLLLRDFRVNSSIHPSIQPGEEFKVRINMVRESEQEVCRC